MKSKGRWGLFIAISVSAILVVYGIPPPPSLEASKQLPPKSNISDTSPPTEEVKAITIVDSYIKAARQAGTSVAAIEKHMAPRDRLRMITNIIESGRRFAEIVNNGPGRTEASRKRVFETFYTTKAVGLGTGLGLSVSYFIITGNHGGEMAVDSRPGSGTKFIIHLPLEGRQA